MSHTMVLNVLCSLDRCVGVSDQLQLFAKEQERKKLLYSSAPQMSDAAPATPKTPSTSKSSPKDTTKTPAAKKIHDAGEGEHEGVEQAGPMCGDKEVDAAGDGMDGEGGKAKRKSGAKRQMARRKSSVRDKQTQPEIPIEQTTPAEGENSLHLLHIIVKLVCLVYDNEGFGFGHNSGETPACSISTTPDSESDTKTGNVLTCCSST